MLKQVKEQLKKQIDKSTEQNTLKRLYDYQVNMFLEALLEARDVDDIAIQVKFKLVTDLFQNHNYSKALDHIEDLLANQELLTDVDLLRVLEKKGRAIMMLGKYEEAEEIFQQLIQSEDSWAKCRGMIHLGITYIYITRYTRKKLLNEAYQLLADAQQMIEAEDQENQFFIFYNMAAIHFEKGRFLEAIKYLEMTLNVAELPQQQAFVFNEIAKVLIAEFKTDEAEVYLDRAEHILTQRQHYHERALAWNLHIRGLWHKKNGQFSNAMNCFEMALMTFVEKELFSEAAEVSYELYVLNKFLENGEAEEYLADYEYYSRLIS